MMHSINMKIRIFRKSLSKIFLFQFLRSFYLRYLNVRKSKLGFAGKNVVITLPIFVIRPELIFLYDNTNISANSNIISAGGKFIMKKNSGAAGGLSVITGNHVPSVGGWFKDYSNEHINDVEKDVIVEEDVWIGANVTLLGGVVLGRGSIVGAGAICRNSIPPYSIVLGNPAKVVGFKFSPDEIIEHEKLLYSESERYKLDFLENNYNKHFINKIKDINLYLK